MHLELVIDAAHVERDRVNTHAPGGGSEDRACDEGGRGAPSAHPIPTRLELAVLNSGVSTTAGLTRVVHLDLSYGQQIPQLATLLIVRSLVNRPFVDKRLVEWLEARVQVLDALLVGFAQLR